MNSRDTLFYTRIYQVHIGSRRIFVASKNQVQPKKVMCAGEKITAIEISRERSNAKVLIALLLLLLIVGYQ